MKYTFNVFSNDRGSSLVVVLVFASFITLIVGTLSRVVDENGSAKIKSKILDSRNLVLSSVLRNTRVATYYYKTITTPAPGLDPAFVACMVGDGINPLCNAGGPFPLDLIDDSAAGQFVIRGTPTNPVLYDVYGRVCTTPSVGECMFEAWAVYNVTCPRSGSPCLQAATIDITVSLRLNSSIYPSDLITLPDLTATQVMAISDFFDFFDPAFPPVIFIAGAPGETAQGAPISGDAGPGAVFRYYAEPFSSSGLCIESYSCSGSCTCIYTGAVGGGGGGGGPSPIPALSSCPPGSQSIHGVCTSFNF